MDVPRLSDRRWWLFWLAFAAALALRLAALDNRPLHHDEGVNGWFLTSLLDGHGYRYDPERFHGPFLYYLSWLPLRLFGQTPFTLRLPVALASAALVPLLLPLRRRLGVAGTTLAAWLLALSPSLVYFGRDLIHETYLAVLTLALVGAVSRWLDTRLDTRKNGWLVLASACLGLAFTVKETAVLTVATLALAAALAAWSAGRLSPRELGREIAALPAGTQALVVLAFAVPYFLLFTSFLSNPPGLIDSFRAFLPWTEKGVQGAGHEKPWTYFPDLLLRFEAPAVLGALGGTWAAVRRRAPFGLFCAAWWIGQLAVYSAIPYKTPWLVLNMVLPMAVAAGFFVRELAAAPVIARVALTAVALVGLTWEGGRAIQVSFVRYDDERIPLVYVQSKREMLGLVELVRQEAQAHPERPLAIRVWASNRWPLPWYFRGYTDILYGDDVPDHPDGDVLIVDPGAQDEKLRPRLRGPYRRHEFLLRPAVRLVVYVAGPQLPPARPHPLSPSPIAHPG